MGSGDITKEHDKLDRVLAEIGELRAIMNGFGNGLASVKTDIASVRVDVAEVKTDVADLKVGMGSVESRLAAVETRLTSVETRLTSVESRVDDVEEKLARRLQETKPMWVDQLKNELRSEMQKGFRELSYRIDALAVEFNKFQGYQRDLDDRVTALEHQHL
jgi:predicted  nucleic acid-binding Zn-ribbon protein